VTEGVVNGLVFVMVFLVSVVMAHIQGLDKIMETLLILYTFLYYLPSVQQQSFFEWTDQSVSVIFKSGDCAGQGRC
jgi:hypothetical protein